MEQVSIPAIANKVQSEADAYVYLERMRWNGTPVCPHCDSERVYFLTPKDGTDGRKTRTGSVSQRRVWKCGACRKQFSVLTGTIFHGTKIPVKTWLFVFFEMCSSKNGVSAREIERKYELSPKSAWYMTQRIREAMKREPVAGMLGGGGNIVVVDETWIGGKPKNKHQQGRPRPKTGRGLAGSPKHMTPVLSLIDTATGEARSKIVPDVTGASLRKHMSEHIDMAGTVLHTDGHMGYRQLGTEFLAHEHVDHSRHEYVRGNVTSNQAENFFSQLKRSLDGTHHHVSVEHLPRYLAEFDFRYTTREMNDSQRMARLMGQTAGRRLSYRPLTER